MSAWPSVEDVARVLWESGVPGVTRWDARVRDADIGGSHATAAVAHYRARAAAVLALFPTVEAVEEWNIEIPNVGLCTDDSWSAREEAEGYMEPGDRLVHRTAYRIEPGPWAGEEDA